MAISSPPARDATAPPGSGRWQPGKKNFFCPACGKFSSVDPEQADPAQCTNPGCERKWGAHDSYENGP
ncbi:MAG: hypothetical protein ACREI7_12085 [Myxococcota bacterium]